MVFESRCQTEIGLIPENWKVEKLGSCITTVFCGRDPSGGKQSHSKEETGYRIIQSAPVFDGYLEKTKVGFISKDLYNELKTAALKENDVLLNQLGDGITFARSCVVPPDVLPAVITRSVGCIRCKENTLDPWFLNAFLILPKTKSYIESFNSGSSRRAIDGGKMRSFLIPIPPMNEQKQIGSFYKKIQTKIALNEKMNATLESIGAALFRRWFVDFEFPNQEGKPYKTTGGKMGDSEFGEIPIGWSITKLGKALSILKDGTHTPPKKRELTGIRFIAGASDLKHFEIDFSRCTFISKSDYKTIHKFWVPKEKDVLLTIVGTVGNVAIVKKDDLPFSLQRSIAILRAGELISYVYLYFLITSNVFKRFLLSRLNPTAQPGIYLGTLSSFEMILPPEELIDKFTKLTEPLVLKMISNNKNSQTLSCIRDSLLPKLMSGKIRVPLNKENLETT